MVLMIITNYFTNFHLAFRDFFKFLPKNVQIFKSNNFLYYNLIEIFFSFEKLVFEYFVFLTIIFMKFQQKLLLFLFFLHPNSFQHIILQGITIHLRTHWMALLLHVIIAKCCNVMFPSVFIGLRLYHSSCFL